MRARARIDLLADPGSFVEEAAELHSEDPLEFFDLRPYTERLAEAEISTGLADAMVIGRGAIDGRGTRARRHGLRLHGRLDGQRRRREVLARVRLGRRGGHAAICVTSSGGARMQEGILALMQLPKTVAAVEDLRDSGQALLCVMAHPTTGGVLASFATLGDVLLAEPNALMSFAGPRVVQEITREKLPDDFGRAEQNVRYGQIDAIVPRPKLRATLSRLLRLFDAPE